MWKVLKRYLNQELGLREIPNRPKPIFKLAAQNQLFASDIAQWGRTFRIRVWRPLLVIVVKKRRRHWRYE